MWKAYLHHMESQKGERELQRKRLRQIVEEFKKSDGSGKQEEQVREMSTVISSCSYAIK